MSPSYWPTAPQELCFQAALGRDEAALAAWRRLAAAADLEALDGAPQSLLPLIYYNLVRLGVDDAPATIARGLTGPRAPSRPGGARA